VNSGEEHLRVLVFVGPMAYYPSDGKVVAGCMSIEIEPDLIDVSNAFAWEVAPGQRAYFGNVLVSDGSRLYLYFRPSGEVNIKIRQRGKDKNTGSASDGT